MNTKKSLLDNQDFVNFIVDAYEVPIEIRASIIEAFDSLNTRNAVMVALCFARFKMLVDGVPPEEAEQLMHLIMRGKGNTEFDADHDAFLADAVCRKFGRKLFQ